MLVDFQTIVQLLSLVKKIFEIILVIFISIYLDIEPRHLEPVEFIVSGSATGIHNTLEQQYPNSSNTTGNLTTQTSTSTTKRTVTSRDNTGYNETINIGSNQSYAPYFITSLRDQTVKEGESVLFEIVVSGKNFIILFAYLFFCFFL